ncbi:unnamed protein product [Adineta ricciae]|uniref:Poly A polymerase head domain-containing protein n=1 Tax=Adineta ricciae TaxID=249248 RepID=A0A815GMX2_ADIRI|nr:unnamed protein product [Adineta ricciae]CAF1633453.1 unnamed protein product [Adineta ricciae]
MSECQEISQDDFDLSRQKYHLSQMKFYNQTKYFLSKKFSDYFREVIEQQEAASSTQIKFGEIFSLLLSFNCEIFIHGGAIRDLILNLPIHDIDGEYFCSKDKMKSLCNEQFMQKIFGQCQFLSSGHLILGQNLFHNYTFDPFEAYPMETVFTSPMYTNEYTTNTIFYDVISRIIIDITGYGIYDTLNRIIRLTITNPNERYLWLNEQVAKPYDGFKKLSRYWKLRADPHKYLPAPLNQTLIHTDEFIIENVKFLWKNQTLVIENIFRKLYCDLIRGDLNNQSLCYLQSNPYNSSLEAFLNYDRVFERDMGSTWFNENILQKNVNHFYVQTTNKHKINFHLYEFLFVFTCILILVLFLLFYKKCSNYERIH